MHTRTPSTHACIQNRLRQTHTHTQIYPDICIHACTLTPPPFPPSTHTPHTHQLLSPDIRAQWRSQKVCCKPAYLTTRNQPVCQRKQSVLHSRERCCANQCSGYWSWWLVAFNNIIMYIYRALINALSTHMIHVNLKMMFYTHVEQSPIRNNLHKVLYGNTHTKLQWIQMCMTLISIIHACMRTCTHMQACRHARMHMHTHTHTHTHTLTMTSRNWVLILVGPSLSPCMVPAPDHALPQPICTVSETVYNNSNAGVTGAEEVTVDKVITVSTSKSSRRRRKVPTRLVRNQKAEVERVRVVEQVTHVYSLVSVPPKLFG